MARQQDLENRLNAERLAYLFNKVDQQLEVSGIEEFGPISIIVCGGAAMCYRIEQRQTVDVDVLFPSLPIAVKKAINVVAEQEGLEEKWMNDSAQVFVAHLPVTLDWWLYDGKHLRVVSPSNENLLGMKLAARREASDLEDAVWLMEATGLTKPKQLRALLLKTRRTPDEPNFEPTEEHEKFIEACVTEYQKQRKQQRKELRRASIANDRGSFQLFTPKVCNALNTDGTRCQEPKSRRGRLCAAGHPHP